MKLKVLSIKIFMLVVANTVMLFLFCFLKNKEENMFIYLLVMVFVI